MYRVCSLKFSRLSNKKPSLSLSTYEPGQQKEIITFQSSFINKGDISIKEILEDRRTR